MPRRSSVTYDSFFRKAEAVQELYGRVTYERMREVLGSGSMSTYKPLMERWRKERRDKTSHGVPRALSERIDIVVRDIYRQIAELATQDRDAEVGRARDELEAARERLARSEEALGDLRERLVASEARVERLEAELRASLRTNAELSRSFSELVRR